MGLMSKQRDSGGAKAQSDAEEAWTAGLRAYVFTPHTAFSSNPSGKALSAEVDAIMSVGWVLHSTAMTYVDKTGMNNVTMMFTFLRP